MEGMNTEETEFLLRPLKTFDDEELGADRAIDNQGVQE